MAKVVLFPQKEKLPGGLEKEVHRIAKEYIEALYAALELLAKDPKDRDEMERINGMVAMAYAEGLEKAIDELE